MSERSDTSADARPYRLVARAQRPGGSRIRVGDVTFGGDDVVFMAGPCAIESKEQIRAAAERLAGLGIRILRGGAFKPRTSPYAFQGLGSDGWRLMRDAADAHGLLVVSEVMSESHVDDAVRMIDLLQVGSRNMQNFALLKALARTDKPVLLKRGMSATYEELLSAAEYLVAGGNPNVILCERGIRTFEPATRNSLDISAVPMLHALTHLPVIVDPSHAAGRADLVPDLLRAAIAAGADGVMVEMHAHPETALSDGVQALLPEQIRGLMPSASAVARAVGRRLLPEVDVEHEVSRAGCHAT